MNSPLKTSLLSVVRCRWREEVAAAVLIALGATNLLEAALPSGWSDSDIGAPGLVGAASYGDGFWTVTGGGADIGSTNDQFHFAYVSLAGNGVVIARVISQNGADPGAQAGVMLRDSASAGAIEASLVVTPSNGVSFHYRLTTGGASVQTSFSGFSAPLWLRLVRSGSTLVAQYSASGVTWSQFTPVSIPSLGTNVLAGLAVTAHDNSALNTASFADPTVIPGPQVGVPSSLPNKFVLQTTWPLPQLDVATNALRPRMGWNSYFTLGVSSPGPSESAIKAIADALVTNGFAAAGYNYLVIDDGWIGTGRGSRDTNGDLVLDSTLWPSGMAALADYVHARGLRMGGYSDIGALGYGAPQQIGMFGYYQHDADLFASWGWDFIKIDDHGPGDFYEATAAIARNASGRPMVLSLSTPQTDGVQFASRLANSYRVANDISFVMGAVTWSAILTEFDTAQTNWFAQAPGHWNDPDMLCTGMNGISDLEGRTHFNLLAILGAPLMLGTDVRRSGGAYAPPLSDATLTTLTNTEVIAIDQDSLGAVGRPIASDIYAKLLGSFTSGQYGYCC